MAHYPFSFDSIDTDKMCVDTSSPNSNTMNNTPFGPLHYHLIDGLSN